MGYGGEKERETEKERKEEERERGGRGWLFGKRTDPEKEREREEAPDILLPWERWGGACLLNGQRIHVTEKANRIIIITPGTTYYYVDSWGCITMDWIVSTKKKKKKSKPYPVNPVKANLLEGKIFFSQRLIGVFDEFTPDSGESLNY